MSTIHSCSTPLGARAAVRCGTARYSTEKSIVTRNVGTASTASASHSFRPALGPVSAVVMFDSVLSACGPSWATPHHSTDTTAPTGHYRPDLSGTVRCAWRHSRSPLPGAEDHVVHVLRTQMERFLHAVADLLGYLFTELVHEQTTHLVVPVEQVLAAVDVHASPA